MNRLLTLASVAAISVASLAVPGLVAAAPIAEARLDSADISLGEAASLSVSVEGDASARPEIPTVPGLHIDTLGQAHRMTITNGAVSSTVEHHFRVVPQRAGDFTIPSFRVGDARTEPVRLHVSASSSSGKRSAGTRGTGRSLRASWDRPDRSCRHLGRGT